MKEDARIRRERKTIAIMVSTYCRANHGTKGTLCPGCNALLQYANSRLSKCPFAPAKPTCAGCPVHCYQPAMRERVKAVMRFSGPRMLLSHPLLTAMHLIDGRRKVTVRQPLLKRT